MSRRLMIWSAPVIASILASACAGRQPPSPFDAGRGDGEIRVEVDNDNYLDVAVFAMHDQAATRLGTVSGLSSATLSVPGQWVVMGRLRLLVDPIGSAEAYLTEDIPVSPGDIVVLHVSSSIRLSSWSVRSGSEAGTDRR